MRRTAIRLAALIALACVSATPGWAQTAAVVPHAWLFGTWTGGLFPAPQNVSREACLGQPVVIFTRDIVLRATLTEQLYSQRVIETVRATKNGAEFQFLPSAGGATSLLGLTSAAPAPGFGCENPNVLHVERHGPNEITFPGCSDFPNPLVRCP